MIPSDLRIIPKSVSSELAETSSSTMHASQRGPKAVFQTAGASQRFVSARNWKRFLRLGFEDLVNFGAWHLALQVVKASLPDEHG